MREAITIPSHLDRELGVHTCQRPSESYWLGRGRYRAAKCMLVMYS